MKLWILLCLIGTLVAPLHADGSNADQASLSAKKESYQKQVEDDLNSLSKKIDDLRRKSEKAGADTRAGANHQIDSLDKKLETVQRNLTNLKNQTADDWEKFRTGLDKSIKDLKKSYQKTSSKFN